MQETNEQFVSKTKPITDNYIQNLMPYEVIIESIQLQNQELQELQKQYIEMKQQVKLLPEMNEEGKQFLNIREKQLLVEQKLFSEEALIANQKQYHDEFLQKKAQLTEQIDLLQDLIEKDQLEEQLNKDKVTRRGGQINIFMNLNEGLLNQILDENRKSEEAVNAIKFWKESYQRSKKSTP